MPINDPYKPGPQGFNPYGFNPQFQGQPGAIQTIQDFPDFTSDYTLPGFENFGPFPFIKPPVYQPRDIQGELAGTFNPADTFFNRPFEKTGFVAPDSGFTDFAKTGFNQPSLEGLIQNISAPQLRESNRVFDERLERTRGDLASRGIGASGVGLQVEDQLRRERDLANQDILQRATVDATNLAEQQAEFGAQYGLQSELAAQQTRAAQFDMNLRMSQFASQFGLDEENASWAAAFNQQGFNADQSKFFAQHMAQLAQMNQQERQFAFSALLQSGQFQADRIFGALDAMLKKATVDQNQEKINLYREMNVLALDVMAQYYESLEEGDQGIESGAGEPIGLDSDGNFVGSYPSKESYDTAVRTIHDHEKAPNATACMKHAVEAGYPIAVVMRQPSTYCDLGKDMLVVPDNRPLNWINPISGLGLPEGTVLADGTIVGQ